MLLSEPEAARATRFIVSFEVEIGPACDHDESVTPHWAECYPTPAEVADVFGGFVVNEVLAKGTLRFENPEAVAVVSCRVGGAKVAEVQS
jgi:hypothetical protein